MARQARRVQSGVIYHVLNRGNGRERIFHKDGDYAAFLKALREAGRRAAVDVLAYCIMPNHWHLVLRPRGPRELARFVGWLCTTHVRRYHEHYHTRGGGHVYQGRFKSFPVQEDGHLLRVLKYVEANARRAKLADRAERWPWGSAWARAAGPAPLELADWPVRRRADWVSWLNDGEDEKELTRIRQSIARGRPYGDEAWVAATARRLGLMSSLRPVGRPRKKGKEEDA